MRFLKILLRPNECRTFIGENGRQRLAVVRGLVSQPRADTLCMQFRNDRRSAPVQTSKPPEGSLWELLAGSHGETHFRFENAARGNSLTRTGERGRPPLARACLGPLGAGPGPVTSNG